MTGFDGIIEARANQISNIVRRSSSRLIPGEDRRTRRTTTFEKVLGGLGAAEEVLTKAVGNAVSSDAKYDWNSGVGKYHTQVGFADLFRDTGMPSEVAAVLGIAAAIANPLDPLNKFNVGKLTKLGKAAKAVGSAGDNLVKGADSLWRIGVDDIVKNIADKKKALEAGEYVGSVADNAIVSIKQSEEALKQNMELNDLLIELQQRGVSVEKLKLAGSFHERLAQGQQHLFGFSSPKSLDQLSLFGLGRSPTADTSIFGLGGAKAAALVRSISGIKDKVVKPIADAAYKAADYLNIPTTRTLLQKKLATSIKAAMDSGKAEVFEKESDLLNLYQRFFASYGPTGKEAAKADLLTVLQKMEFNHEGTKEMAIAAIAKVDDYVPIKTGKGVEIGEGGGITEEQKLKLTQSGVEDAEIPIAIKQFDTANTPSIRVGKNQEHEAKVLGRYVVVKTSDPKIAQSTLNDLDEVYGNRSWAKHSGNDGATYLVQKRHPGASRITKTDDFHPEHLRNLEVIAAKLAQKQKGFTALSPGDILVSNSGAVQIINPSVIVSYKSAKQAVTNSKQALESLADSLAVPRGSSREMPLLKNTITAKSVKRSVDNMAFRVVKSVDADSDKLIYAPAQDLLDQAANTQGYKDIVRASYDNITPTELAEAIHGHPTFATPDMLGDFERANNIEFHRKNIREALARGEEPVIEPISIVKDDLGNLHIANGRDRLTAAILEGYEAVPIYKKNFIGDAVNVEQGYYIGKTLKLVDTWNVDAHSSGRYLHKSTRGLVSKDYSILTRDGQVAVLDDSAIAINSAMAIALQKILAAGPNFNSGNTRAARITSVTKILEKSFGSVRNAMIRIAEIAEASQDSKTFASEIEKLLKTGPGKNQGIFLDNYIRHAHAEEMLMQLKAASKVTLDSLSSKGVFTAATLRDPRRLLAATDNDFVIQILDRQSNTLQIIGNKATTTHLKKVADNYLNSTVQADDIQPYARVKLVGADGVTDLEVKDFVTGQHPKIADVLEPRKVFVISEEYRDVLKKNGILVHDGSDTKAIEHFNEMYPTDDKGRKIGVLLGETERPVKSTKTGRFVPGTSETSIVRPEYSFFVTRSGAVVVGVKQRNVKDLLETVFEEGPAYFEEFGIMTTGKVIVSNPFGGKMAKIGSGEINQLKDRIQTLATRFKELGLSDSTVIQVKVPFDDAVWRTMYGERVTIGDILDENFKINIPKELKGHIPDIRILAPGRVGGEAEVGVVGIQKTRLANEKMQRLFDDLTNLNDELFLKQAKAGLPIAYYSSWFGRNLTTGMKEALSEAWLKNIDKQSSTFKNLESVFNKRVITDLTTQELNQVIKRLKKEGVENADEVISSVVKEFRNGYVLKPTVETAKALIEISKITPEGIDFFHLDPIYGAALSVRNAVRATTRKEIVDSIKELGVAAWHGTPKELEAIKIGKSKQYLELKKEIKTLESQLDQATADLTNLSESTPDIKSVRHGELSKQIDELTVKLANKNAEHLTFLEKMGKGKVMDTMVDLESENMWIRGDDLQGLVDKGIIKQTDVVGDPSDAFVMIPAKKYASQLDPENSEVFIFTKEVEPVIRRYFQTTTTKEGIGKVMQLWDTVHSAWRNWTLFPIPAYHVRNAIGNLFLAHLGGITDARSYAEAFNIMNITDSYRKGGMSKKQVQEALGAISYATATGQVVTGQQVYDEFVRHGGFAGGVHYNEFNAFGSISRASEFERMSVTAGLRPSSDLAGSMLTDNAALRLGVSAAAYVENRFRLAAFVESVIKGHTEVKDGIVLTGFEAAAMNMKRIFYDYSDLSVFERSWLRRVIPFYSWSRHNIPRMFETLVTNPIVHYRTAKLFHEVETGAVDGQPIGENDLPQWLRERFGIITDKTKNGNYIVKVGDGFLPMIDAYKFAAGGSLIKMVKDGITPFFKLPIEQLTNYSWYTEKPIEKYAGERASSFTLGQLGFSKRSTTEGPLGVLNLLLNESMFKTFFRPGGEAASKLIDPIIDGKDGPGFKLYVYGLFVGRAYEIDPKQARMAIFKDWSTRRKQLVNLRNQALSEGNITAAEDATSMINWLTLQYPGDKEI